MQTHKSLRHVVVNIEITGLEAPLGDRIIEIALVELIDGELTARSFHTYLNPERDIPPAATAIHGITFDMLVDKPKFADVEPLLTKFLRGAHLVAHNAPFEVGFIDREFDRLQRDPIGSLCLSVTDTLAIARQRRPRKPNTIIALCKAYGIAHPAKNIRGALLDAYLLAQVYQAMIHERHNETSNLTQV